MELTDTQYKAALAWVHDQLNHNENHFLKGRLTLQGPFKVGFSGSPYSMPESGFNINVEVTGKRLVGTDLQTDKEEHYAFIPLEAKEEKAVA